MMLKSLFLTIVLFLASTLLIVCATFASPLPQGNLLIVENSVSGSTTTEMETPASPEGETTKSDVSKESQPSMEVKKEEQTAVAGTTRFTYPQPPNPYDMEAIEKFNQEIYGEGN
ncbi:MAG: hypothetical protein QNJ47_19000 [Nostocaceae cyanobacterium]|nr:hypothetical protein [Nostocaceae cyanobacterium]